MKSLATMVFCLTFVAGASAQPTPKDLPPVLRVVVKAEPDKSRILYKEITYVNEPVKKKRSVLREDGLVEIDVFEDRFVPVEGHAILDIGLRHVVLMDGKGGKKTVETRFITTDGKPLAIAEVWKRVKAETVIAISKTGETPAPAYLRALHPDTVVVIPDAVKENGR